ncbi:helix-turn-helix domain-containing protein [Streptomyces sp. NPDC050759]|uniref:helix-turn-helix domain-containing protein n=1 Tax=Streptomyces sp. NPDC050759 TaxID=3365635 RepID=UPI00378DC371
MRSDSAPDWIVDRLRTLGQRIRAARQAQNLSQEDLGRATGLGRSRVDQVERGADDTSLDDLLLIAHVLDVLPADLVAD